MKIIKAKPISYGGTRPRSSIKYIVIHYTGNKGDTAENNGNFYKNYNIRKAGAHFFVGQDGAVVKSIPLNRVAWSVGGSRYSDYKKTGGAKYYDKCGNYNSVSIELCDNVGKKPSDSQVKGVKNTIKYIRKYCKNADIIIRHFDVTGKPCPGNMIKNDDWKEFLKRLDNI